MTYPNISEIYWKAIWTTIHILCTCECNATSFVQECKPQIPRESVSRRHIMEKSSKIVKKQCSLFPGMWKSEQPFLNNTHTSWVENFFGLWVNFDKKATSDLFRWHFSKAFFSLLPTINTKGWKESKAFADGFAYWLCFEKLKKCVWSKKFRIFGGKNGFARSLPLDADESMMPFSSMPLTSWTTSTQIYWSSLLHFHLHWRIDGQSLIWSTNAKVEIWWILPSKHIGVGLKARLMVGKRNGLGLNWEVPTQISKWYHILLILVERQNANIVEFTQMQQMLNDWERMWYWLSRLWLSKKELHFESKSHASLLVKMHSKRFWSRFLMQTSPFWFAGAGKNHLLKAKIYPIFSNLKQARIKNTYT